MYLFPVVLSLQYMTDTVSVYGTMDASHRALQGSRACLKQRLIRSVRLLKNFWYDSVIPFALDSGSETSVPSVLCDTVF
jgi:hypothetical protein